MGYRATMIGGTKDGRYEVLCYEGDDCVWEEIVDDEAKAKEFEARYLGGEFRDGFPVPQ